MEEVLCDELQGSEVTDFKGIKGTREAVKIKNGVGLNYVPSSIISVPRGREAADRIFDGLDYLGCWTTLINSKDTILKDNSPDEELEN